jgi:hypothetical protein
MRILTRDSRNFVLVSKSFNSEQVHTEHQLTNRHRSLSCLETMTYRGGKKTRNVLKFSTIYILFPTPIHIYPRDPNACAHACSGHYKFLFHIKQIWNMSTHYKTAPDIKYHENTPNDTGFSVHTDIKIQQKHRGAKIQGSRPRERLKFVWWRRYLWAPSLKTASCHTV